ncbi:hypothetical protein [Arachidicoccus sp.]|uniref:hypothetical protein n=1 Tax=Arachidicoccus sp. TaxID=1872624 RepID=UPI003D1A0BE1
MKSIKFLLLITIVLMCFASFSFTTNFQKNEWGEWKHNVGYPEIEYRVRIASYNEYAEKWQWDMQFRNTYDETITFNYGYSNLSSTCKTDHTIWKLKARQQSSISSALVASSSIIYICIDKEIKGDSQ